jgi:hypothetical protein
MLELDRLKSNAELPMNHVSHVATWSVLLILPVFAWSLSSVLKAEGGPGRMNTDSIQAALESDRSAARERAVRALTLDKGHQDQIVDAVCDHVHCYSAIRVTGGACVKRLVFRLQNRSTREAALCGLALMSPTDLRDNDVSGQLQKLARGDDELQLIAGLLQAIASPVTAEIDRVGLAKRLADANWSYDVTRIHILAVSFDRTRDLALGVIRDRVERALPRIDAEAKEVPGLIGCLLYAAARGPIEEGDIGLMNRLRERTRAFMRGEMDPFEPAVPWATWLGRGRRPADLVQALQCSGAPDPPYEIRFLYRFNQTVGDILLTPSDVPALIGAANDQRLNPTARVGAIRILRYTGAIDPRAHDALCKLLTADSEPIRRAVAEAIGGCVENGSQRGRLLAAVAARLREETSQRVIFSLRDAESLLRLF